MRDLAAFSNVSALWPRRRRPPRTPVRWRAVPPLLAVTLALSACQSANERAAAAQAQAQQLAAMGDYRSAQKQFDTAVRLRDDSPDLWIARARNQIQLGNYSGAFASFRAALDQDRSNREAIDALAQLSLASNALDDAGRYADQLLAVDPGSLNGRLVRATVALRRGRLDAAEQMTKALMAEQPDQEVVRVLASRVAEQRGDLKQARALIEPIFAQGGGSPDLRRQLAALYQRDYDARALLTVARREADARSTDRDAQVALARVQLLLGQDDAAAATLATLYKPGADDATRDATVTMLADADVTPARLAAALKRASVPSPALVLAIAEYAVRRADWATARRLLAPYDGQTPTAATTDAQGALAAALAGSGDTAGATRLATAVLAFDEDQPMALTARATAALAQGDANAALRDARVVLRDDPTSPYAYALLARIYSAQGDTLLADRTLADGARAATDDATMLRTYATMLMQRDRLDEALSLARTFTLRNPLSASAWATRQRLCRAAGDPLCAARSTAILAKLHGQAISVPPPPPDETTGSPDYSSPVSDDGDSTP